MLVGLAVPVSAVSMLLLVLEDVQAVAANKNRLMARRDIRALQVLPHPKLLNVDGASSGV